ncbi:MAG: dockerin type I domain-containing protein [candidate division Zixibacteria bacterium]|nr:dockerin type I domain-containing protein [candidate division Zixibacteria bacterium]
MGGKYLWWCSVLFLWLVIIFPCKAPCIIVQDFLVNTDSAVGISQKSTDIAFDSAGNFIVAYSDRGKDHAFRQIYFQRFDSQASRLGGLVLASDTIIHSNNSPKIAMRPSGSFILCWSSYYLDQWDIQMRRYDRLGNPLGPPQQVDVDRPLWNGDPYDVTGDDDNYITMDKDGNFIVLWAGVDSTGNDIWAQRFDSEGNRIGNNFLVSDFDNSDYPFCNWEVYDPRAAYNSQGYLLIVWYGCMKGCGWSPGVTGARIYNPAGEPVTKVFPLINSCASKWAYTSEPEIVSNSQNNFILACNTFDTFYTYPHGAILVQTFDTLGNPVDTGKIVNDVIDLGTFSHVPRIARDDKDGYVVIWPDARYNPPLQYNLWAQRFDSSGEKQGQNYRINLPPETVDPNWDDFDLSIQGNTVGFTWHDYRNYSVYNVDVFAKLLELDKLGYYYRGDVVLDGEVDTGDVIYLINYLFRDGWRIQPEELGDINGSGDITISDVIYLINHLFKGGPPPQEW